MSKKSKPGKYCTPPPEKNKNKQKEQETCCNKKQANLLEKICALCFGACQSSKAGTTKCPKCPSPLKRRSVTKCPSASKRSPAIKCLAKKRSTTPKCPMKCAKPKCAAPPKCVAAPKCTAAPKCAPSKSPSNCLPVKSPSTCSKPRSSCSCKKSKSASKKCARTGARTRNPFLNYLREFRTLHCGATMQQISVEGGKCWNAMTDQDKWPYIVQAYRARKRPRSSSQLNVGKRRPRSRSCRSAKRRRSCSCGTSYIN